MPSEQDRLVKELKSFLGESMVFQGACCPVIRLPANEYNKHWDKIGKNDTCYYLKDEAFHEFPLCIRVDFHGSVAQYYVLGENCHREGSPAYMQYDINEVLYRYFRHGKPHNEKGPTAFYMRDAKTSEFHPYSKRKLGSDDYILRFKVCTAEWLHDKESVSLPYGSDKGAKVAFFKNGYIHYKILPDGRFVEYGDENAPGFYSDTAKFEWFDSRMEKSPHASNSGYTHGYVPFYLSKLCFSSYQRLYDKDEFIKHEAGDLYSMSCNSTQEYDPEKVCPKIMKEWFSKWDLWRHVPLLKDKQDVLCFTSLFY